MSVRTGGAVPRRGGGRGRHPKGREVVAVVADLGGGRGRGLRGGDLLDVGVRHGQLAALLAEGLVEGTAQLFREDPENTAYESLFIIRSSGGTG